MFCFFFTVQQRPPVSSHTANMSTLAVGVARTRLIFSVPSSVQLDAFLGLTEEIARTRGFKEVAN